MIDYEIIKDIFKRADEFDKNWLTARGLFTRMHSAGIIADEDYNAIIREYDKIMGPINSAQEKVENYVVEKLIKIGIGFIK